MKTLILIFLSLNIYSQTTIKINNRLVEFKSDESYNLFQDKLLECFNDEDFNFTDIIIDNNYFLISKVLILGEPKLYVSSFFGTVIVSKSKLKRFS